MIPIWALATVGGILLLVAVVPGLHLWWPGRTTDVSKSDLGVALLGGALIAFAVFVMQFLVEARARQEDQHRAQAAEHQTLQVAVGSQDLSGIDLSQSDLRHLYLGGKILRDANLLGARLDNAVLIDANLRRAELTGAQLNSANLDRAVLADATLTGAQLQSASLYGAILAGANFEQADLTEATLTDADARSNFSGSVLRKATLDHTNLRRANLSGADLRGAWLVGADLSGAFLYGARVQGAKLYGANLKGAFLQGANLQATGATLRFADLTGAKWSSSTLWPSRFPVPECTSHPCVYPANRSNELERHLGEFRLELATELPRGWRVVPKDPTGVTVQSGHGEALFHASGHLVGLTLKQWAKTVEDQLAVSYEGFTVYQRDRPLRVNDTPALSVRYGFRKQGARLGVDVYFVLDQWGYRFHAESSPRLFALFEAQFRDLFDKLGAQPNPLGSSDEVVVPSQKTKEAR